VRGGEGKGRDGKERGRRGEGSRGGEGKGKGKEREGEGGHPRFLPGLTPLLTVYKPNPKHKIRIIMTHDPRPNHIG